MTLTCTSLYLAAFPFFSGEGITAEDEPVEDAVEDEAEEAEEDAEEAEEEAILTSDFSCTLVANLQGDPSGL